MSAWVIDASLALQWFWEDEADRDYSLAILKGLSEKPSKCLILILGKGLSPWKSNFAQVKFAPARKTDSISLKTPSLLKRSATSTLGSGLNLPGASARFSSRIFEESIHGHHSAVAGYSGVSAV